MDSHDKIGKHALMLMAEYNIWATYKLTAILRQMSDEDFYQDTGLFFKSIFGTLNHLLLGEHELWFKRFSCADSPKISLNAIIETDREPLLTQLEVRSHSWNKLIRELDDQTLSGNLSYQTASGEAKSLPYAAALLHVFNHGTHHRGQMTAALTSLQYPCPELDLVYMLIEQQKTDEMI